jgi:CheY-like chemotaxis protein
MVNPNKKILIVDDTRENLQSAMKFVLEDEIPYSLLAAQNGQVALQIANLELPDIIIMDWEMPVMNGIEATIELKRNTKTQHIPIIISTGIRLSSNDLKIALEAGASDFIRKPLEKVEFISRINSHLKLAEYINTVVKQSVQINEAQNQKNEEMIRVLESNVEDIQNMVDFYGSLLHLIIKKADSVLQKTDIKHDDIKEIISSIEMGQKTLSGFSTLNTLPDSKFVQLLLQKHANLTPQEIQLCYYLKRNLQSKDIASITFRELTSVKVARSRLRKKLGLSNSDNLTTYFNQF